MSAQAFAQTIITKLKGAIGTDGQGFNNGVATTAMQAVAAGITEYLLANTQVIITYTGVIPAVPTPVPDPVVTDTFRIIGQCAPTGPSDSFDMWIRQIETNIMAGFQLAPMGMAGVVLPTIPWAITGITTTQSMLKAIHTGNEDDPQLKVWTQICQDIMIWAMGTGVNRVPMAATHPAVAGTGMGVIATIIIN